MYRDDFAIFILSHGRPDNVVTLDTLKKSGYTGKYYIIIDNEDKTADTYYKNFGKDKVIMFDKQAVSDDPALDKFDNGDKKGVIYFARNACFDIAKELGLKYFLQFDDDYTALLIRYPKDEVLANVPIKNMDKIVDIMLNFLDIRPDINSVCFAQGGDLIGGVNGRIRQGLIRKAMNSFFCRADAKFRFHGRINEDVNTYTMLANRGELFFTVVNLTLNQKQTQSNAGGMTDIYLDSGTYVKSFYSVICAPQAVKIGLMGRTQMRMHHKINWKYCAPMILSEVHKKR